MDNIGIIIQARMGARRLPNKMMLPIMGKLVLQVLIERLQKVKNIDRIIVATTMNLKDRAITDLCKELKVDYFIGNEHDVLGRVTNTAIAYGLTHVVDITGDCPLVDINIIDMCINTILKCNFAYVSNIEKRTYPDGMDVQVYTIGSLLHTELRIEIGHKHRAHSGWNILQKKFYSFNFKAPEEVCWPELGLTLDEQEDYELICKIFEHFKDEDFTCLDIVNYLKENPKLLEINKKVKRKIPGE